MRHVRPLRDLPNQEGYRFIGVDLDYAEHECIVVKDAVGCHTVHRVSDDEPFFFRLYAWRDKNATPDDRVKA